MKLIVFQIGGTSFRPKYVQITKVRDIFKTVPIIAMTANAYDIDVQNCFAVGMNAHLAKPINPDELFAVLASILQKEVCNKTCKNEWIVSILKELDKYKFEG